MANHKLDNYTNIDIMLIKWFCFTIEQNRVLKERCSNMDKQLKSSDEDNERMRTERDGLRARLLELQSNLKEKEGEVRREGKREIGS